MGQESLYSDTVSAASAAAANGRTGRSPQGARDLAWVIHLPAASPPVPPASIFQETAVADGSPLDPGGKGWKGLQDYDPQKKIGGTSGAWAQPFPAA